MDISTKCDINHKVTYIFFNTGIEYEATKEHIKYLEKKYGIEIIEKRPKKPIPVACAEYGVPFISKKVSEYIGRLQKHGFKWEDKSFDELFEEYPNCKTALRWWCNEWGEGSRFNISRNKYLKEYMIDNPPPMKISSDCCKYGKKDILHAAIKDGGYDLNLTGMRRAEGGARSTAFTSCFKENDAGCDLYMPVWWYTDTDKEIYREYYNIERSKCYTEYGVNYPPPIEVGASARRRLFSYLRGVK